MRREQGMSLEFALGSYPIWRPGAAARPEHPALLGRGRQAGVFLSGQGLRAGGLVPGGSNERVGCDVRNPHGVGEGKRMLVTSRRWGRGCPLDRTVAGGRVWFIDPAREDLVRLLEATLISTPTEGECFAQLSVPCWLPHERTVECLRGHLQQT